MMKRSKKRTNRISKMMVGLAYYTVDEWRALKQVASDSEELDDSYEDWQQNLGNLERQLRQDGIAFKRVNVRVDELVRWCTEQNLPINGEARSQFAAYLLRTKQDTK